MFGYQPSALSYQRTSSTLRKNVARRCDSEPFAFILSPSLVILSGAKNLALPLRVNCAKSLS
jgi:hypothetical protein